ncbi:MAG: solute carrier family 23 protein, partial [Clostridia bacterium]
SSIVCGKDFIKDPGVHRTLLGDGLATMAAGLVGGPCNTTYGENTAVLSITHNYNPKVLALAAVFAVVLGVFTKVGTLLGTIPAPVIGGASLVLYGMIAANGLKTIVEARVDFSDSKNMIICSLILVIGIGMNAAGYALSLGKFVSFSALAVATFVGIIVNAIFMLASKSKQVSCLSGTYGGELTGADEKKEEKEAVEKVAENAVVAETAIAEEVGAEEKTAEKKETIAKEKAPKAKK